MRLKKEFARRLDGLVRTGNRLLVYDSLSDGLVSDADVSSFLVAFLKMQQEKKRHQHQIQVHQKGNHKPANDFLYEPIRLNDEQIPFLIS